MIKQDSKNKLQESQLMKFFTDSPNDNNNDKPNDIVSTTEIVSSNDSTITNDSVITLSVPRRRKRKTSYREETKDILFRLDLELIDQIKAYCEKYEISQSQLASVGLKWIIENAKFE